MIARSVPELVAPVRVLRCSRLARDQMDRPRVRRGWVLWDELEQESLPEDARGRASAEQHRRHDRRPSHVAIHTRFDRSSAGQAAPQEGGRTHHVGLPGDHRGSDREPDRGDLRMHRSVRVRGEWDADIIGNDGGNPPGLFPELVDSLRVSPGQGRGPARRCSLDSRAPRGGGRDGSVAVPVVRRRQRCEECRDPAERTRVAVSSRSSLEPQARASRAGRTSGRRDVLLGPMEHQAQDEK
jgi:hypothetical protein